MKKPMPLITALGLVLQEAERGLDTDDQKFQKTLSEALVVLEKAVLGMSSPKGRPRISIPFSSLDLQELQDGKEFNWVFPTQYKTDIDVHIYNEEA